MDMIVDDIQRFDPLSWVRDLDGFSAWHFLCGIFRRIDQGLCRLTGHDALLHFEPARLSLYCHRCGYQSVGWEIGSTRANT